jgi:hypothetical protein
MEIKELSLINQKVYEAFIPNIDNSILMAELNTFYANVTEKLKDAHDWNMRFPDAGPESEKLKEEINIRVNAVAGKQMECREFWMFSMKNGGSVPRHNHKTNYQLHPEEYYSIVYYPLSPAGAANLNFIGSYCNTMESSISVKSESGKLIIFNSFLDHYTDRHLVDAERVCISANYKPSEPDKSLVSDWTRFAKPGVAEDTGLSKFS